MTSLVQTGTGPDGVFRIAMTAPRANALDPALLEALSDALDALERSGAPLALLTGGRNFSTGGDVARFHEAAVRGEAAAYADRVVPRLQDCVARMLALPAIIAVAARGAITGGSAGLLFAADLAVVAPDAFVQPYYGTVGFAPDGGWTAILPERIGAGAAFNWVLSDRRAGADELCRIGLAAEVHPSPEDAALARLTGLDRDSALSTKRLIWDASRRNALNARLRAEADAFRLRIATPGARAGMARFLGCTTEATGV